MRIRTTRADSGSTTHSIDSATESVEGKQVDTLDSRIEAASMKAAKWLREGASDQVLLREFLKDVSTISGTAIYQEGGLAKIQKLWVLTRSVQVIASGEPTSPIRVKVPRVKV